MSTVYSCNKKLLRAAARAYAHEYRTAVIVPFCINTWYSAEELTALERKHADWLLECHWLTNSNTDWFVSYCAWCYEERDRIDDDNEHEECDLRLHYCSEEGKAEQAAVLNKQVIPRAPATVIAQIMAFL
jgi:hypothetical protein